MIPFLTLPGPSGPLLRLAQALFTACSAKILGRPLIPASHHPVLPRTRAWVARSAKDGAVMARMDMTADDAARMNSAQASGEACFELGMMYACGRSVPPDLVAAHKWFNIAVARGFRPAADKRADLAQEMSPAEIAAAQREARLWLSRH